MDYKGSQFVFLLKNGEFAMPVKVTNKKTGKESFRSAPYNRNRLGNDLEENEVEVSESKMIKDVLSGRRRTRSISPSKPIPSLRGLDSKDVVAIYVLNSKSKTSS